MKQIDALRHVAHSGGSLFIHSGRSGRKFLVCREDDITIGMSMLDRLLVRNDLETVSNAWIGWDSYVVLTDQGRGRL